ncbi:MAG: hypothetical protein KatS3mg087_2213 [Patescibacteria group bacterium]|nr:MAG: hypothetical protein KatS3mg087_2213 [Patescibacteria group bacterium]
MAISTKISNGHEKNWIALMMGQTSKEIIRPTTGALNGTFRLLLVLADATINTLDDATLESGTFNAGDVLPANVVIGGEFSNISISSGLIIAYR